MSICSSNVDLIGPAHDQREECRSTRMILIIITCYFSIFNLFCLHNFVIPLPNFHKYSRINNGNLNDFHSFLHHKAFIRHFRLQRELHPRCLSINQYSQLHQLNWIFTLSLHQHLNINLLSFCHQTFVEPNMSVSASVQRIFAMWLWEMSFYFWPTLIICLFPRFWYTHTVCYLRAHFQHNNSFFCSQPPDPFKLRTYNGMAITFDFPFTMKPIQSARIISTYI